jgi:MFS family permease
MTIDRNQADAMLADIEAISHRVKQSAIYRVASVMAIFWGAIVFVANVVALFDGRWAGWSWAGLDLLGVAGSVAILRRSARGEPFGPRLLLGFAIMVGFGFVWSTLLGHFGPRELNAFWPTLFMFAYAMAGLWFGFAFTIIGIGLAALVVAGYYWTGETFGLYLAAINGGGLALCGLWMRRA